MTTILDIFFCVGFRHLFYKKHEFCNNLFKQINFAKLMANLDSAMPRYP